MFLKNLYNRKSFHLNENLWFWIILCFIFFTGLDAYPLLDNNEGLYGQIPWEMLQRDDFIIPYLKGVPYIEKPPLLYWLISLSYSLFGKSAWAARLVPALAGLSTCLALKFLGTKINHERWGRISALILGTSLGFSIFSRMVFFDVLLTALFTWAIIFFYVYTQLQQEKYLKGMYIFLGLAVLAKGFLSLVIAGLIILIFQVFMHKSLKWIPSFLKMKGIFWFLIITVPWHVMASLSHSGFAYFYFINEHVLRFLDLRLPRDYYRGPWWYYVPRILGYLLPWTFIIPTAFKSKILLQKPLKLFLWTWFLVSFIFFSISQAKANYYMVIGLPPLACLMGWYIQDKLKIIKSIISISLLTIVIGIIFFPKYTDQLSQFKTADLVQKIKGPLYLYKRCEQLSSLIYYTPDVLPIINSESHDLAYGKSVLPNSPEFIRGSEISNPCHIVLLDRDKEEFNNEFVKKYKIITSVIFSNHKVSIIKVTS